MDALEADQTPTVSVVISTYNRAGRLPRLVAALDAQTITEPFEVVIVDNGSSDGTWEALERLATTIDVPLRAIRVAENHSAANGRNAAWRAARAPLVVFTDDDCRPDPAWLDAMVTALGGTDIVQGCTLPDPDHAHQWGSFSHTMEMRSERGWYETCNIGYHRRWLEDLDGFDEFWRRTGEDTDLAWRAKAAGATTTFAEDAVVYHEVTPSDYAARLRSARRWDEVPLIVARHPHLRTDLYHSRWFWRESHPKALVALTGVAVALSPSGSVGGRLVRLAAGAALARPYWRFRTVIEPLRAGPRRRRALIPAVWLADLAEVAVLARASMRHRTLYL